MHEPSYGAPSRKRSSSCISSTSTPKNEHQPFLSSYGSAFLSGIFADIAHASTDEDPNGHSATASHQENCDMEMTNAHSTDAANINEPSLKKARTTASTSFGRQPKSCRALAGLAEGAISEVSSPSVVSPRPNTSTTLKIQLSFNDQVRELQGMAFPSLPQIPVTVSSSSCSAASATRQSSSVVTPRDEDVMVGKMNEDQDQSESYGWFVNMDEDEADTADQSGVASTSMFLPDTKPADLAFNAITAPSAENQDLEVQQALAADTIDDVLGDLF